jgi:hypothetical protein
MHLPLHQLVIGG